VLRFGSEAPDEFLGTRADGPGRGLMRDHVIDIGQVDSGFTDRLGNQGRHVLDRHFLQRPGFGVHLSARTRGAGEGEAQPAVLGEGGEADDVDASTAGCAFHDHGGTRVTERQ
jgi:hypothetical protein